MRRGGWEVVSRRALVALMICQTLVGKPGHPSCSMALVARVGNGWPVGGQ